MSILTVIGVHEHPLPSSGLNHNHTHGQQAKPSNKGKTVNSTENHNTSPFTFKKTEAGKTISVKEKLNSVKKTLLSKVGNDKYPYICMNSKRFGVECVIYDHQKKRLFDVTFTQKPKPYQFDNYDYENKTVTSSISGSKLQYTIFKNEVNAYEKLEEGNINQKKFINVKNYGHSEVEQTVLKRTENKFISLAQSLQKSDSNLHVNDGKCYLSKKSEYIICISDMYNMHNYDNGNSILAVKSYIDNPESNPGDNKFKYDSNSKSWSLRTENTDKMTIHKALSQVTKNVKKISHIKRISFR